MPPTCTTRCSRRSRSFSARPTTRRPWSRLARRQEHALRAWMAGESELASETLSAALREIVAEVEEEYRMTVELTAIGDRPLDTKGEALVAAAREALRNAGRHAPGAPVYMFCEIGRDRAEVFVRDEGPGFVPDEVANERRGIRDAMIGRMAVSGGRATIESSARRGHRGRAPAGLPPPRGRAMSAGTPSRLAHRGRAAAHRRGRRPPPVPRRGPGRARRPLRDRRRGAGPAPGARGHRHHAARRGAAGRAPARRRWRRRARGPGGGGRRWSDHRPCSPCRCPTPPPTWCR